MEKQVAEKKPDARETVRDLLYKNKDQILALVPRHLDAERMLQIALVAIRRVPKLAECHPATLIGAVIESLRMGLEPGAGAGESWLIPFDNKKKRRVEVVLIPDYRGLLKLIRRSGEVGAVMAEVVREGDDFDYGISESGPYLSWKPTREKERGQATHFFCGVWNKGRVLIASSVMTSEEIDEHAKRFSRAYDEGPWQTDFRAMGIKTVVRRAAKQAPTSSEVQRAVELDEKAMLGIPQDLGILADPDEMATPENGGNQLSEQDAMPKAINEQDKKPEDKPKQGPEPQAAPPDDVPHFKLTPQGPVEVK